MASDLTGRKRKHQEEDVTGGEHGNGFIMTSYTQMHLRGGGDNLAATRRSSSPVSALSSPPSSTSTPPSPSKLLQQGRANIEMDEIVVDTTSGPSFGVTQPPGAAAAAAAPTGVRLTLAGVPKKKPGRKPGSHLKPKVPAEGSVSAAETTAPKARRTPKPKDPNAPPVSRKRKSAAAQDVSMSDSPATTAPAKATPRQTKLTELNPKHAENNIRPPPPMPTPPPAPSAAPKMPGSMLNILNRDPSPERKPAAPPRSSGMAFDPVRESMVSRDAYGTAGLTSPCAPTSLPNRASASPSISSLVDPIPVASPPTPSRLPLEGPNPSRAQDRPAMPNLLRDSSSMSKPVRKSAPAMPTPPTSNKPAPPRSTVASISNGIPEKQAPSKKIAAVSAADRKEKKAATAASSPSASSAVNGDTDVPSLPEPGNERSILDFGKAGPGTDSETPSIVLDISFAPGETNKYVNFMRMAEDRYGWDALHPRLAANRERKARIAAAASALEKTEAKETEEEDSDNSQSDNDDDNDNSNVEMGGMGNGDATSGAEGLAKPKKGKRRLKEDEYDRDDDFVDDSEMLWEEQASASKDGFFVYMGPLVPESDKPAASTDGAAKRGRGGRRGGGPGSRGGRTPAERAADRAAAAAANGGDSSGPSRRGGGPGSRGGLGSRKPRITKVEKEQLAKEKADREKVGTSPGAAAKTNGTNSNGPGVGNGAASSVPAMPEPPASSGLERAMIIDG